MPRQKLFYAGLLISFLFFSALIFLLDGSSNWGKNAANLTTLRGLQQQDATLLDRAENDLQIITGNTEYCQGFWLLGSIYESQGQYGRRDQAWENAILCSPQYIHFLQAKLPKDVQFAELAVKIYPDQADAWFWLASVTEAPEQVINYYWQGLQRQPLNPGAWVELGRQLSALEPQVALIMYEQLNVEQLVSADPILKTEPQFLLAAILAETDPNRAVQLYRQGLEIKPNDGIRWYQLGDILAKRDPSAAIEAYLQSCSHGDPGSHGCYGAGLVAEEQGDIQSAIQYYRLSTWEGALQRADQLEQGLQ